MLVNHYIYKPGQTFPEAQAFDYILAGNGIFLRAARIGFEVLMPVQPYLVRGLEPLKPQFLMHYPRVPAALTQQILAQSIAAGNLEVLFYLSYSGHSGWRLICPEQEQGITFCRPCQDDANSPYARAIINIHSHHQMSPDFSPQDNTEDQGFRLYGVVGNLPHNPSLNLRVGVFGHFWQIPADWVFELPVCLASEIDGAEQWLED